MWILKIKLLISIVVRQVSLIARKKNTSLFERIIIKPEFITKTRLFEFTNYHTKDNLRIILDLSVGG